ncbi:MAG: hypothetical protein IH901_08940 [Proteobacteria bacterium]|nr:hypothetical protein [Pseudomonadota bacterium]
MGVIRFYEGPEATQHYIGKLSSDLSQTYDLSLVSAPIPNEEALSCTLIEVQPGTKIKLFNSHRPSEDEGYTEIIVRSYVENKCVPYFNVGSSDEQVEVKIHKGKGEPGKVSRIEVHSN